MVRKHFRRNCGTSVAHSHPASRENATNVQDHNEITQVSAPSVPITTFTISPARMHRREKGGHKL